MFHNILQIIISFLCISVNFNSKEKQIERTKRQQLKKWQYKLTHTRKYEKKGKTDQKWQKRRNNLKYGNVIVLIIMSRAGNFKK